MAYKNDDKYFASEEPEQLVCYLKEKSDAWFNGMTAGEYLDKIKRSWQAYYGFYYENSHAVSFGGESGELVNLPINHYGNIASHILTMVTATRPSFQARSVNTDVKSQIQTNLANGLLEYYMRDKRLEQDLKNAVEHAVIMGSGYIKMEWNATTGEIYDFVEPEYQQVTDEMGEPVYDELGKPVYEEDADGEPIVLREGVPLYSGDIVYNVLSPYDVVFDPTKSDNNHNWQLARSFKNKYDLAAKYPELEDKIKKIKTKSDINNSRISMTAYDETTDVPVYEFYHKPTESLPKGRYVMYLDEEVILEDTVLIYKNLPIFRIAARNIIGTPFSYTAMFDLLPIQDAVNSLYSTIMTNQTTFGVQNVYVERGSDVQVEQISDGLNFIQGNPGFNPPIPLNLTNTPAEIFNFVKQLEQVMETISGVNSVARGNPESQLKSGNALALIQSQALQFISSLQQSYIQLIEDVGTNTVELLKTFAKVPRVAAIAGKANTTYMKEFSSDDLSSITRVIVDAGNALAQCLEKGTEVLMHDGTKKKVEDIQVGDLVMGPDSAPRTVGNVNSGTEQMFKVKSKDKYLNVDYGCNESHILTLKYCSDDSRYNAKKGDILDISVRDYMKLTKRQKNLLQGFKTGVEFEERALSIPPYILGTWLGDGTSSATAITTKDVEILDSWSNYAVSIGMKIRQSTSESSGKASTYFITSGEQNGSTRRNFFMNDLRGMELIDNKHIPFIYKTSSRQQRLELLAGLIDTDGSRVQETYVFTQKSDKLTKDVVHLAQSLGFKVKVRKKKQYASKMVPNATGTINYVAIGGNTWEIPCKLPRKICKPKAKIANWLNYGIEVTPVGEGTYYGFTLNEEPHFVLGDFSVTHNTTAGRVEMASQMMQMGIITTPEQYISVINTGKLETMTEGQNKELLLVRAERERLVDGSTPVVAVLTDAHSLHIREHKAVLADPDLRMDAELVQRTLSHIQEHINILSDPNVANILSLLGEQPLSPPGGSPVSPENAAPSQPNQQGSEEVAGLLSNPEAQSVSATANQGALPAPASPPPVQGAQGEVAQPQTPEAAMANQIAGGKLPPKE